MPHLTDAGQIIAALRSASTKATTRAGLTLEDFVDACDGLWVTHPSGAELITLDDGSQIAIYGHAMAECEQVAA